jgi:heptosyltransferase III
MAAPFFHNFKEKILFLANYLFTKTFPTFLPIHKNSIRRILVVKIDEIGDMVLASPIFEKLHSEFPNAQIDLWCKPAAKSLLIHNPFLHRIFTNMNGWDKSYDIHIELRGTYHSLFKALYKRPKYRVDRGTVRYKNKKQGGFLTDIETNFKVVESLFEKPEEMPSIQIFSIQEERLKVENYLNKNKLTNFVLVHATANKALKEWRQDRFAEICRYYNYDCGLQVVFLGAQNERARIEQIQETLDFETFNIAGEFSLTEFYEVCKKATLYLGNDSGPMHIANAAGLSLIGLFGPGPALIFYPQGPKVKIHHFVLPCNPCNQEKCIQPQDNCMDRIEVAAVKLSSIELLKD